MKHKNDWERTNTNENNVFGEYNNFFTIFRIDFKFILIIFYNTFKMNATTKNCSVCGRNPRWHLVSSK